MARINSIRLFQLPLRNMENKLLLYLSGPCSQNKSKSQGITLTVIPTEVSGFPQLFISWWTRRQDYVRHSFNFYETDIHTCHLAVLSLLLHLVVKWLESHFPLSQHWGNRSGEQNGRADSIHSRPILKSIVGCLRSNPNILLWRFLLPWRNIVFCFKEGRNFSK